jgi:hypothetical protein
MSGDGKEKFDNFATTIGQLNKQFEEGKLGGEQYFSSLKSGLEGMNLDEMFGGNTEGAQAFFTGIVSNAANSLTLLNTQFDSGKITLEEYMNQLTLLGGVFETIGSMTTQFADTLGLPASQIAEIQSAVDGALGNITSGISELQGMQELNMAVQHAWVEQTSGSLQFGTEAYAQYMTQIAELAGMANQTITDVQGNVISGSANIRSWLMADAGNFSIMANQTAKKTGESIQTLVQGAGTLLSTLGESIKNFTFKISFTPDIRNSGETLDIMGVEFPIPTLDLNITGSGNDAVANIGQAIMNFGNALASSDFNFDASSLYGGGATATTNPFSGATSGAGGLSNAVDNVGNSLDNASDSAGDLADNLRDVKKEAIDSLKAQLKGYKDIVDARKKMLDSMAEERDYQNQVEEKNNEILQIQNELATLQFDNSEESQARRLQLEDDLAQMQGELEDIQFDYSIDQQKASLDAEYQAFESTIESAIQQVQGIQATNLQQFAQQLSAILSGIGTPSVPQFHSGVEMGAVGSQFTMKSNEMFAKLLKGEVVVTPQQMDNFMKTTLPTLSEGSSSFSSGDISIDMPINVNGNLDKSVLPDLEKLTQALIGRINDEMMKRGYNRRADLYSI